MYFVKSECVMLRRDEMSNILHRRNLCNAKFVLIQRFSNDDLCINCYTAGLFFIRKGMLFSFH